MGLLWGGGRRDDRDERIDALERQMRELRVDWDMTYEKFSKLLARLAKRAKREAEAAEEAAPSGNGTDPISARILKARAMRAVLTERVQG